jgi:ATP-dependent Clp protease protease subunit
LYENTYPESDMQKGIEMLSEVKEVIINAFEAKTRLERKQIAQMMDAETWFSALLKNL